MFVADVVAAAVAIVEAFQLTIGSDRLLEMVSPTIFSSKEANDCARAETCFCVRVSLTHKSETLSGFGLNYCYIIHHRLLLKIGVLEIYS